MKKVSLALITLAAVLAFTPVAKATEDSFNFSFSDGAVSGSGTLYGTYQGSGTWLLDSGSGTFNDGTGSGVINLQANPNYAGSSLDPTFTFGYDDQLTLWTSPNQYLDGAGLFFTYGNVDLNLYQSGGGPGTDGWFESNGNGDTLGTFAITSYDILPSETPEPGTLPLLGTGLIALAGLARRSRSLSRLVTRVKR